MLKSAAAGPGSDSLQTVAQLVLDICFSLYPSPSLLSGEHHSNHHNFSTKFRWKHLVLTTKKKKINSFGLSAFSRCGHRCYKEQLLSLEVHVWILCSMLVVWFTVFLWMISAVCRSSSTKSKVTVKFGQKKWYAFKLHEHKKCYICTLMWTAAAVYIVRQRVLTDFSFHIILSGLIWFTMLLICLWLFSVN